MASSIVTKFSIFICLFFFKTSWALSTSPSSRTISSLHSPQNLASMKFLCKSTPYPEVCLASLKISINININTISILSFLLHSLETALSETAKLSDIFTNIIKNNIVEKQKGTIQDCIELHQITLSAIRKSMSKISTSKSTNSAGLADTRAFLSAALTNKNTCLEGLTSASGPSKQMLVNLVTSTYQYIGNSLSILSKSLGGHGSHGGPRGDSHNRRLLGLPEWLSKKGSRILEDDYDPTVVVLTVAADGTGNFTTISDAINFAPNNSLDGRIFIYIRQGLYEENVEIPSYKPNIVMLGDGSDVTVITGNRSVGDGWTTFRSATVAVSGEGFLARDITFENRAGPEKQQAVALRVNADLTAMYRCTLSGYQDTLYTHSFRQFYRECDISGTIDYIFGNAAVIFQGCNIISKMPLPGQFTVITAQSRDSPDELTGTVIQNCSIFATNELYSNSSNVKSYLGRPWKNYSRTVYTESYIDDFITPEGWTEWSGDDGLDTLYYGEYENNGPGSGMEKRVSWPGYHVMDYYDASNFTVSDFIAGEEWLDSTSFPYDDGV